MGLGVKGDVHEIEQLYSKVSGINLKMAGYQMTARGMIPMGVQVLGTILNKCVSTADNK